MLQIILGFAFLIFIHELGHFAVARWFGIRCPQFAIGFGQALVTWRQGLGLRFGSTEKDYLDRAFAQLEKSRGPLDAEARQKVDASDLHAAADAAGLGQTEYRLNWIPLGGYVKMVGQEDMDPNAKSKDPAAFSNKPASVRGAVLVAGVVMNLVSGLVFLIVAFQGGVDFPSATVGGVVHGSPAEEAGLQVGDRIVEVDGKPITDYFDLKMQVALADKNRPMALGILRDGQAQTVSVTPAFNEVQHMQTIGVAPGVLTSFATLDAGKMKPDEKATWEATPFGKFGGDHRVASLDGKPVADYGALFRAIQETKGRPAQLGIARSQAAGEVSVPFTPVFDAELFESAVQDGKEVRRRHPLGILPLTKVGAVVPASPAESAGLRKDDILLMVEGVEFPTFGEFQEAVRKAGANGVAITVEREGRKLAPMQVKPRASGKLAFLGIGTKVVGLQSGFAEGDTRFIADGQVAGVPGAMRGSRLLTLAGEQVANWNDIQRILMDHAKEASVPALVEINVGTASPKTELPLPLSPEAQKLLGRAVWSAPANLIAGLAADETVVRGDGPLDSIRIGMRKTRDSVVQIYLTIGRLFQGSIGSENVSGVVGIVATGAVVASHGTFMKFIYLLGVISINLAVMNLLPIPVLDGGHLVFLAYEKITGKPLPEKAQTIAFIVGLSLLGALMLYATWNDLVKLLG